MAYSAPPLSSVAGRAALIVSRAYHLPVVLTRDPSQIKCDFEERKEPGEKRKRGTGPSKMAMMEAKIGTATWTGLADWRR